MAVRTLRVAGASALCSHQSQQLISLSLPFPRDNAKEITLAWKQMAGFRESS